MRIGKQPSVSSQAIGYSTSKGALEISHSCNRCPVIDGTGIVGLGKVHQLLQHKWTVYRTRYWLQNNIGVMRGLGRSRVNKLSLVMRIPRDRGLGTELP